MMKLERQSEQDRLVDMMGRATAHFTNHRIVSRTERSWLCYRPHKDGRGHDAAFSFEASVLHHGYLLVTGDIDHVLFGHYGRWTEAEAVLRWMGRSADLNHYVSQKARIGMGSDDLVTVLDERVWVLDALHFARETYNTEARLVETKGTVDIVELTDDQVESLPSWLADFFESRSIEESLKDPSNWSTEACEAGAFDWGRVPSFRLIHAYAALRRLCDLLDEERAGGNP